MLQPGRKDADDGGPRLRCCATVGRRETEGDADARVLELAPAIRRGGTRKRHVLQQKHAAAFSDPQVYSDGIQAHAKADANSERLWKRYLRHQRGQRGARSCYGRPDTKLQKSAPQMTPDLKRIELAMPGKHRHCRVLERSQNN